MSTTGTDAIKNNPARMAVTSGLLVAYMLVQLICSICFREGGINPFHWLYYFIVGNAFGISSTALLMAVYGRMQINLAMVLSTNGTFVVVQSAFFILYHAPLSIMQIGGIALVGVGTALFACAGKLPKAANIDAVADKAVVEC